MKPLALFTLERSRKLEALDRDGLVEPEVVTSVHDAEAPLPDDVIDAELGLDCRAYPTKRICFRHAFAKGWRRRGARLRLVESCLASVGVLGEAFLVRRIEALVERAAKAHQVEAHRTIALRG